MQLFCSLSLLLLGVALSNGYSIYRDRLPNGRAVPHPCKPNYLWHGVGHENPLGGGSRNAFGRDFIANGATWNTALCQMDSDGDGQTNGQELGDPDCIWTVGTLPARVSGITHPGVCTPWNDARCQGANDWVQCDVTEFECDALNHEGTQNITFKFPSTPVPNTETNYMCMTFDLPGDEEYHLIATQPFIDNEQVMHHILVYGCEAENPPTIATPTPCGMEAGGGCNDLIGLWTVGLPGMCLQNVTGFKFGLGQFTRVKLEFHWNNPELRSDYTDGSGMTMYYTNRLRPTSAATMMLGQNFIEIPPLQPAVEVMSSCKPDCTRTLISQPLYVIEAYNHMHYLGISQKVELIRNGTRVAYITNEEAYSYDSPLARIHDPPLQILPGDELKTTCTYNSQTRSAYTYYGDATSAEMCFAFLTIYPREALPYTTACVSYGAKDMCERYFNRPAENTGCDFSKFTNTSDPWVTEFGGAVYSKCTPFGECTAECQQVWDKYSQDPCFQGANLEALKRSFIESHEGTYILAALSSCWNKPQCPKCQECTTPTPVNNNNNNNNNNINNNGLSGDETGAAGSVLPGVVAMVMMTSFAFLFTRL